MSDIANRPNRTPRRVRERRANQILAVGGIAAIIVIVSFMLTLVGIGSLGPTFLALLVVVACVVLFRKVIKP